MCSSLQRPAAAAVAFTLVLLLAACAGGPGARPDRDGPPAQVPEGLAEVPDAQPRVEPIRVGGPNKPYEVMGMRFQPFTDDRPFVERGLASWYGRKFHGRSTANGETYDMFAMTAAHPTMPLPSYATVRNPANGREVVVRVNDRGPFHRGRIIDLSYAAALKLDLLRAVAPVEVRRLTAEAIREGRWRAQAGEAPAPADRVAVAAAALPTTAAVSEREPVSPASSAAAAAAATGAMVAQAGTVAGGATGRGDGTDAPVAPLANQGPGFWLQLGAYRQREGAEGFQRRVAAEFDWLAERMAVYADEALFRLQAGPYVSREEALVAAERIRQALHLVPLMQERR